MIVGSSIESATSPKDPSEDRSARLAAAHQFLRFLIVGAANTGLSYGAFALLFFLGAHYAVASLGSVILGMLSGFVLQGTFVFGSTERRRLLRFVAIATLMYGTHTGFLKVASHFGWNLYVVAALLTLPLALWSFVLNRIFVFGSGPPGSSRDVRSAGIEKSKAAVRTP